MRRHPLLRQYDSFRPTVNVRLYTFHRNSADRVLGACSPASSSTGGEALGVRRTRSTLIELWGHAVLPAEAAGPFTRACWGDSEGSDVHALFFKALQPRPNQPFPAWNACAPAGRPPCERLAGVSADSLGTLPNWNPPPHPNKPFTLPNGDLSWSPSLLGTTSPYVVNPSQLGPCRVSASLRRACGCSTPGSRNPSQLGTLNRSLINPT